MARGVRLRRIRLEIALQAQPTETSCGPTCLQAVYAYYGDIVSVEELVHQIPSLETGGTLGVLLGTHALKRGYGATLYSYNLNVLDPTWFQNSASAIQGKLREEARLSRGKRKLAAEAYLEFVERGGELRFDDPNGALIRRYLCRGNPILTGLSATYLYRECREDPDTGGDDDIQGWPQGHFVILAGYHPKRRRVTVADPYLRNPLSSSRLYVVAMERLIHAILLGVLTYDGNLLIVAPKSKAKGH